MDLKAALEAYDNQRNQRNQKQQILEQALDTLIGLPEETVKGFDSTLPEIRSKALAGNRDEALQMLSDCEDTVIAALCSGQRRVIATLM